MCKKYENTHAITHTGKCKKFIDLKD